MRIYARFVAICNICFLASVVLRFVEMKNKTNGKVENIIPLPVVEGTLVVLGYAAIIFNLLFLILSILFLSKARTVVPRSLMIFNLVIFVFQVWYFFFS